MPERRSKAVEHKRETACEVDPINMLAVYLPGPDGHGTVCCGHIMPRGKSGFEAFDRDDRSVGIFPTQSHAADAVTRAAR
jgi:hypothetical protein